jgi:hypothetical protein
MSSIKPIEPSDLLAVGEYVRTQMGVIKVMQCSCVRREIAGYPPMEIINDKGEAIAVIEAPHTTEVTLEVRGRLITDCLAEACLLAGQTQPGIATCNTEKEKP